jgi:hypothetical protein
VCHVRHFKAGEIKTPLQNNPDHKTCHFKEVGSRVNTNTKINIDIDDRHASIPLQTGRRHLKSRTKVLFCRVRLQLMSITCAQHKYNTTVGQVTLLRPTLTTGKTA